MEGIFLDEGKRWVERAIAFYEVSGKNVALAEFADPRGPFVQGGHYVYVLDIKGTMLAHPINAKYMGQDFYGVQDAGFASPVFSGNDRGSWVDRELDSYEVFEVAD